MFILCDCVYFTFTDMLLQQKCIKHLVFFWLVAQFSSVFVNLGDVTGFQKLSDEMIFLCIQHTGTGTT